MPLGTPKHFGAEVVLLQTAHALKHPALPKHGAVQQGISGKYNKDMMYLNVRNVLPFSPPPRSCLTGARSYKGSKY